MTLREHYRTKGIKLAPAGIWERDENGKKRPIVAFRADGLDFSDYPEDNIAKCRIEEIEAPEGMRVLVVDADSEIGLKTAMSMLPQCEETFNTQTSQSYKRHFFFYVPKDKFEEFRAIGVLPDVDILTYGVLFEAHFFNEATYQLPDFDKPILELDEQGQELLLTSLSAKNTNYCGQEHTGFVNKEMAHLVIAFTRGELDISSGRPDAKVNRNNLFKQITPKHMKTKGQRRFEAPPLSHDTFNTIALLVAKNLKIPNDIVQPFLEKLLTEVYEVDLNSKETHKHLYNSILPTLPYFESLYNPMEDFREFDELIEQNSTDNQKDKNYKWVLFATNKNGTTKYVQVNKFNYKLRNINGVKLFDESFIRKLYPNLAKDDLAEVPHLAITANPYEDIVIYDEENEVFTLNTLHPSKYKVSASARADKPDNVLTLMIEKFFLNKEHEEFYYHWLAHLMYGNKPINTVVWFASEANAEAGTGKTILTSALPAQLIGFDQATTVDSNVASAGWGQIFETKLLSYNDLNQMRDQEWLNLYAKIKDEGTNSTSKLRNNKGGDVVKSLLGVCQSGSSNFIPKVDGSDRRFFIVSPKERLKDQWGADEIHRIFEEERLQTHQEIQEIADYLKYLYEEHKNKFRTELYTRAPMTAEKKESAQKGAHSHSLLVRIMHSPKDIFDLFKEKTAYTDEWQDWQIITFIKLQTYDGNCWLPVEFLNYLISRIKGIDESRSIATILDILNVKKDKVPAVCRNYNEPELVEEAGLPREVLKYSDVGIKLEITTDAYKNFMPKKLAPDGIHKIGG